MGEGKSDDDLSLSLHMAEGDGMMMMNYKGKVKRAGDIWIGSCENIG